MVARMSGFTERLLRWVGIALLVISPLVVPELGLADEPGDTCWAQCSVDLMGFPTWEECITGCCSYNCEVLYGAGTPEYTTCYQNCSASTVCNPNICDNTCSTKLKQDSEPNGCSTTPMFSCSQSTKSECDLCACVKNMFIENACGCK